MTAPAAPAPAAAVAAAIGATAQTDPMAWLPWAIIAVLVLLMVLVGVVLWRLLRGKKDEAPEPAADGETDDAEIDEDSRWMASHLRGEVRRSLRTLRQISDNGDNPYSVPWIIALGAQGADTRALIDAVDPGHPPTGGVIPRIGSMNFCRQGAVFHAGDTLAEMSGGLRHWRRLIRLMTTTRPHRPVDGLVLALPLSMLHGADALPFDLLADRGGRFGEMIAAVQRITGLRVPVSVVITGCHDLQGFSALAAALPGEAVDDALGWANPYALEAAYRAEWADQAVEGIAASLSGVALQLLMTAGHAADPDSLMLLPSEVRGLVTRLKPLLSAMLQPSAYHEAFVFRGIYLTGELPGPGHRGAFVSGLFNGKIFREYQLVRPVRGILTARTRRLRWAQGGLTASVIFALLCIGWTATETPRRAARLQLLMTGIRSDLTHRIKAQGREDPDFAQSAAIRMLQEMARLDVVTLTTFAAPASFIHNPDRHLERAIAVGFDSIVMAEMHRRLTERLTDILEAPALTEANESSLMEELTHFVNDLAEFDRMYRLYRDLPRLASVKALEAVADYALDIELPTGLEEHADLYLGAIALATVPSGQTAATTVSQTLRAHFATAFRAHFDDARLRRRLERISQLSQAGERNNPDAAIDHLNELLAELQAIGRDLDSRDYGWINGESTHIGPAFDDLLARLDGLELVDDTDVAALRQMGEKQIVEARRALFSQLAVDKVPLLHLDGGKAALAPAMVSLRKQLENLMSKSFMTEAIPPQPTLGASNRPLMWDPQWLKTAARLTDDYLAFASTDALKFPQTLSFTVELAAFDQTSQRVEMALAAAARPAERVISGPYQLETELHGILGVSQHLSGLADQLRNAKMDTVALHLRAVVLAQALRLLAGVDAQAAGQLLITRPPGFAWWDGSMPLAARAFREASLPELTMQVEASREALTRLARDYADPLIQLINAIPGDSGNRELVARWQGLTRSVARYEQKDRDSSLHRLEQFILVDMDKIDPARCADIASGPASSAGDLFAVTLEELKAGLARRCLELGSSKVRERYVRLQSQFNESLAGRFPFARDPSPATARADLLAVRRFFWGLEQDKIPARGVVEAALGAGAGAFVADLAQVEKALAPMLVDPTLDQPLSYEVDADFRTNAARDLGGNQIIEWGVEFGGDQWLSSREPKRSLVWSSGQPARLFVRFARNAPSLPAPDPRGRYRVDGTLATWEASDPWALLSLLSVLTPDATRLTELPDRRPHTLELNLALQRNPDAAEGAVGGDSARLYLRLGLTALIRKAGKPDEKMALTLPRFPTAAPMIEGGPAVQILPRE